MLTRVDFPEPEGPVMATHSPATMEKVASSRARTVVPCPGYSRETWVRAMTAHSARVWLALSVVTSSTLFTVSPSPCFMVQSLRNRDFRLGLVCGLKVSNEKARLGRAAFDLWTNCISGVKGGMVGSGAVS